MPTPEPNQPHASPPPGLKRVVTPTTGAVVGTSVLVIMMELARSGALQEYKDVLAPIIAWGPGILILVAFFWLANSYAPSLIESHQATARSLQKLVDAVSYNDGSRHDLVLATQVNSDKLEQLRALVADLHQHVHQLKEELLDAHK